MIAKKDLFPIGIGTWGLGGFAERDPENNDAVQIDALVYMLSKGLNFFEVSLWAAEGWSAKLLAKAIKEAGIKREDIFITEAVYTHNNPSLESAEEERKTFFETFETDYVDAFQFSHAAFLDFEEDDVFEYIDGLFESEKTRYTSITNSPLVFLEKYCERYGEKFFAHEVGFNFEVREYFDNGILNFIDEKEYLNVIFQPLRRNRTADRNWPLLVELSEKYSLTQNQIILSWILSKGYLPLVKSESKAHIDENLGSIKAVLEEEDLNRIDKFRPPNFTSPKVDWERTGDGVRVDQLSNVFDEEYDKQVGK